jgi:PAS domain S-box-containing protein
MMVGNELRNAHDQRYRIGEQASPQFGVTMTSLEARTISRLPPTEQVSSTDLLVSIVENSDDAIISKDLNGVITSWNAGAQRLFGYTPEEAIGRPITILIPAERLDEEPSILARIRRGERIEHFETVRLRKDGSPVDISITVSPIRNAQGAIVGASKIARDISEKRRNEERQTMLLREMNHRVKNLFALASSLVTLSARSAGSAEDLARDVASRLTALAGAHALTMASVDGSIASGATLHTLLENLLAPYRGAADRLEIAGMDLDLGPQATTQLALLLHELTTNSAKYGALSVSTGSIRVQVEEAGDNYRLEWSEIGGPPVSPPAAEGFGSVIGRATTLHLGGEINREWRRSGLVATISLSKQEVVR